VCGVPIQHHAHGNIQIENSYVEVRLHVHLGTNHKKERRLLSSQIETWGVEWAPVSCFHAFLTCRIEKSTMLWYYENINNTVVSMVGNTVILSSLLILLLETTSKCQRTL